MKEIYKKRFTTFIIALCLMLITGKILYQYSPYLMIKNAFENTVNKHKSACSDSYLILAEMSYESSSGTKKTINALLDNSVVGISFDGPDSLYYTIPIDNIKTILKSDYINNLFFSPKKLAKSSTHALVIPALFSLEFDKNIDFKLLAKTFSEIELTGNKGSFLLNKKMFSFSVSSNAMAEIMNSIFHSERKLTNVIYSKDENYLFDIELSGNSLKEIKCITPMIDDTSYCIELNFEYPRIYLNVKNNSKYRKMGDLTLVLSSETNNKDNKYREKSIYSLTVGELIQISRLVSNKL